MNPWYLSFVVLAWTTADTPKEDRAASKLLAEARAARANWDNFPGFTADIEVNFDGKVSRGQVQIDANGKVTIENLDKPATEWAKRMLGSLAAHRMDSSAARNTPCAFADPDAQHPLGRKILVLNDELHSSYRIRDRQIIEVNRVTGTSKFSITVLENRTNAEGKYLPVSYVVNYWDMKTGQLVRNEAHHQTWTRVDRFDLPVKECLVTAAAEEVSAAPGASAAPRAGSTAKNFTLSNHKLLQAARK